MNYGEIFSPILISSSLNPGPGVGGVPDLSPKQQGEEGSQEKCTWWLPALTNAANQLLRKREALAKTSGL